MVHIHLRVDIMVLIVVSVFVVGMLLGEIIERKSLKDLINYGIIPTSRK